MGRPAEDRALQDLRAALDAIEGDTSLRPRQVAFGWQQAVRLAEQGRDEAVAGWAAPDLAVTLGGSQAVARDLREAIWAAQHEVVTQGWLGDAGRAVLGEAAARVVDWLVGEFPTDAAPDRARRHHR